MTTPNFRRVGGIGCHAQVEHNFMLSIDIIWCFTTDFFGSLNTSIDRILVQLACDVYFLVRAHVANAMFVCKS